MPPRDTAARRVLFLAWQGARAGIERHVATLMRALPARYEKAIAFLSTGGPMADELAADGFAVHVLGLRRSYDPRGGRRVLQLVRDGGFNLVHDHTTMAVAPIVTLGLAGVPVVATEHLSLAPRRLDQQLSYRLFSRFVDYFIANSQATRAELVTHGVAPDKIGVIYHGLPPMMPTSRDEARRTLGVPLAAEAALVAFVGRLEPEKGGRRFVAVAARVAAALPDVHFVMVGDGSERAAIAGDIAAAGLTERVHLTGVLANIERVYAAFDVLVSTSTHETFGLAMLEAMAAGVAVAAFGVGGVAELIDAADGMVVTPGDVVTLANAVIGLLREPERRRAIGRRARERVLTRFTAARMVDEVAQVYDQVCARRMLA